MRAIIDRFEGNYAICENESRKMFNIDRTRIPREAREGDVIIVQDENIVIDNDEIKKREIQINRLVKELWE